MSIDKIKKYLIFLMVCILVLGIFNPFLTIVNAEEEESEEPKKVTESLGLLELGKVTDVEKMLTYDEELQYYITLAMLKSESPFTVPEYAAIFDGSSTNKYTNAFITKKFISLNPDKPGDSLTSTEEASKGVFRLPVMGDVGGQGISKVKSGDTAGHFSVKASHLVYDKDGLDTKKDTGVFAVDKNNYSVYVGNEIKQYDLKTLQAYSSYYATITGKSKAISNDKVYGLLIGEAFDSTAEIGTTLLLRGAFKDLGSHIPLHQTLFLDSYGNIVTNDSQVLIPYWMNSSVDDFKDEFFDKGKSYLSTHLNGVVTKDGKRYSNSSGLYLKSKQAYFHEVVAAKANDIKLFKADNASTTESMRKEFSSLFKAHNLGYGNTTDKGDTALVESFTKLYSKESQYLPHLARYIVAKTKGTVKEFNGDMLDLVKETQKEGSKLNVAVNTDDFSQGGDSLDTIDDATKYINDASTLMAKISRILDVGLFELFRLTVASFVSDFYNSNVISFSVSDVFHTSLLTESTLWKQLVNTILLLAVSFTSLYVVFLAFKMFLGSVTPKEILFKVGILAVAVASPMLFYSPLVNVLFNVPSEKILNTEMHRMMVLDTWLKEKGDDYASYEENTGYKTTNLLRDRQEDYTIEFVTNTSVDGVTLAELEKNNLPVPSKQQMITVDVSLFHLMDWLSAVDGSDDSNDSDESSNVNSDTGLFEFLETEYSSYYTGLSDYEEYTINLATKLNGISGFDTEDQFKTASDLIKEIHMKFNSMETPVNNNLVKLTSALFYDGKLVNTTEDGAETESYNTEEIEIVISELAMTSKLRKEVVGTEAISGYVQELIDASGETVIIGESDLLHLEEILKPLKGIRFGKDVELGNEVQDINRDIIEKYTELYLPLRKSVSHSEEDSYVDSEQLVIELETYFAVADYYEMGLFPTGVNIKNLSLDTYVRTMFIPLSNFTPEERTLNDVSEYIALNVDLFSLLLFLIAIVILFIYGLIKFIVLFVLLMPAILILFFFNYVIKNDVNNKAWLGSLTILGAFALINLGLLGIWKGLIYAMNLNDLNKSLGLSGGGYPYTLTNSLALIIYFFIVFKFILLPLYKTVKADITNLGGETFSQKFGDVTAGFSKALGNMWNGGTSGNRGKNDVLGSVDLNDKKSKQGLVADDMGKAGDMGIANSSKNSDEGLSEKDKESLDLINSKMESSGAIQNVLGGKNNINPITNTKNKLSNKVSDKVNGIRGVVGNTAYNALSKTGRFVGGATGELLGNAAGGVVSRAITGTLGEATTGAQAALGIAQLTGSGVGATLAGGILGGILGRASAKAKSPLTMLQAQAVASKLNGLKMKGNKYSNLKDMDESDMEKLKLVGLDTKLTALDGVGSNRANELAYIDTEDMVISEMIANQLDDNLGAVALDNRILLNLDGDEIKDEKVYAQLLNDLLLGVLNSEKEVLENGLQLSELGNMPLASKIGDSSYNLGQLGEYEGIYNKLEEDYSLRGIKLVSRKDENGNRIVDFSSVKEGEDFLLDFEDRAKILSEMTDTKGPLYSTTTRGAEFMQLLNDNNIEYEVEENSVEFGTAIRLSDVHNDGEKFMELLENNKDLSSEMLELTSGHLKSTDDVIVKQLMSNYTNNNELIEGQDVVYRDNDVIAISARGKQVMSTIQDKYDEERANTLAKLQDFAGNINTSLLNFEQGLDVEGGLSFGIHDRTLDSKNGEAVENLLRGSHVGKEHFVMRNDYDIKEMENYVVDIQRRRVDSSRTGENLLPEENDLLDVVARMNTQGIKIERHDDTTLNVYANSSTEAEYVKEYFEGIKAVENARATRKRVRENS